MNDKKLIISLGGPTRVSELLGYSKINGPQRVWNWQVRGIPAQIKLKHPNLFLNKNEDKD